MKRLICGILCAIMSISLVLSASADGSIVPTIYDKEAEEENGVGRLSDEEVIKAATEWLSENAPECIPEIYVEEFFVDYPLSTVAYIRFGRKTNGIPFDNNHRIDMDVNRVTGKVIEVTSFWHKVDSVADPKKMLSEKALREILFEKTEFKLMYALVRDTNRMIPVYMTDYANIEIDAITGEEYIYNHSASYNSPATGVGGSSGGCPVEENNSGVVIHTSKVTDTTGLLSEEEIAAIMKSLTDTVLAESKIESISYSQPLPGKYTAYVYLNDGNFRTTVQLNAKSGEDLYIHGTRYQRVGGRHKTQEEMKAVCDRFLKSQMGDLYDDLSFISGNDDGEFVYGLFKNGIEVFQKKAYIDVDPESGKIYYYSNSADGEIEYEYKPAENLITIDEAWELTLENCDTEIIYNISETEDLTEAKLICRLAWDNADFSAIDARSGKLLNGWLREFEETGEQKEEPQELVIPSDIKGHWAEKAITTLIEKGAFEGVESFEPEENLTEAEISRIISDISGKSANCDSRFLYVIRENAVVYIMQMLGFTGEEEECKNFKEAFSDENAISPTKIGYLAAASNLGIISGYGDGTFRPRELITRAEFATIIYNILVK